jgi:hypothetical protein
MLLLLNDLLAKFIITCTLKDKLSVRNMVPTLTSRKRRGLSLNGRC